MSAVGKLIEIYEEILSFWGDKDEVSIASSDSDNDNSDNNSDNNNSDDNDSDEHDHDHDISDSGDGYKTAPTPCDDPWCQASTQWPFKGH